MASAVNTIIALVLIGVVVYLVFFRKGGISLGGNGGGGGATTTSTSGGGGATTTTTGTIYPAKSHYTIPNPAGQNQNITYASSGKAAISHRADVSGTSDPNQEATVCLQWPSNCTGGGHPELAIKHWGPSHTDSSCCYAYGAAVPQGGNLVLASGGEGPHPSTTTIQHQYTSIPFQAGKTYCFKSIIWANPGGGAHQELYYDDSGSFSGNWKLAGKLDRATVGQNKTSTTIAPNAQVEFRIDCSNVTYSHTDVAAITPGGTPNTNTGGGGGTTSTQPATTGTTGKKTTTKGKTTGGLARAYFASPYLVANPYSLPSSESDDCGCNPDDPFDCTGIPRPTTPAARYAKSLRYAATPTVNNISFGSGIRRSLWGI